MATNLSGRCAAAGAWQIVRTQLPTTLMGLALFLTVLPLSFRFANGRITWTFLEETPPHVTVLVWMGALTCWSGFLYVRRRLQGARRQMG
jgi:hypothetical protein